MLLVDDVNFRFTLSTQAPLNHRRDRTMTTQHDELELQESIERDVEAMKTFPYAWLQNFAEGKADSKGRPVTGKDVELIASSLGNRINSILDSVEDLRSRTCKGEEWKAPKLVLVPAIERDGITKEAARGIWQSQLKHCAQPGYRNKERLISLLRDLSMLTGQDMTLPLGQFLAGYGEDQSPKVRGIDHQVHRRDFTSSLIEKITHRLLIEALDRPLKDCDSLFNLLLLVLLIEAIRAGKFDLAALKSGDDDLRGGF